MVDDEKKQSKPQDQKDDTDIKPDPRLYNYLEEDVKPDERLRNMIINKDNISKRK